MKEKKTPPSQQSTTDKELVAINTIIKTLAYFSKEHQKRLMNVASVYYDLEIKWES
jgi:hypothetical protein